MSCTNPIKAFKDAEGVHFNVHTIHNLELPCGMCIGCRMRHAQDWKIRCLHEASMHTDNCFITLTYGTNNLPPNSSLEHKDFQDFMKRLRHYAPLGVRFYMCGEYGPTNGRPHYHANLFGINFLDRTLAGHSKSGEPYYTDPLLTKLWGHGRATVQDLTPETAGYTTGYIMKKLLGPDADHYEHAGLKPEYARMSLNPAIGKTWFEKYHTDITRHDIAVAAGRENQVPKYYDKLTKRLDVANIDAIKSKRAEQARKIDPHEKTAARRKVREQVALARLRNHERANDL